jgi:hypothetical protein
MIFRHTGGAARLINVLCDAALQVACSRTSGHVGTAEVLLATQDSRWSEAVGRDKSIPSIPESAPTPSAQFLVRHGGKHVATWPLGAGRLSIGRAPDNELRIEAPYISRHHCCVVTEGTVSVIEDLGSVNGLCINGEIVHRHVLQHADQVMLGEHVLTYVFG